MMFIVCISTANSQTIPENTFFESLVQQLVQAQRAFDQDALDQLLGETFVEISPIGDVDDRASVMGFFAPANYNPQFPPPQIVLSDFKITRGQHSAFVIVKETFKIAKSTSEVSMRAAFSLTQTNGKWVFNTAHYTPIPWGDKPQ